MSPPINLVTLVTIFKFLGLCLLNGIAVYLINAGLGYEQDRVNERLLSLRQFNRSSIILTGFLLLIIALTLLYFFSERLLLPALVVYGIWIIYSLPNGLKGVPLLGMVCAFIAQLLHFHLGYLVFSTWSMQSILLAVFFSLLFMAGHALHEVIDHDADKQAGIMTSAVFFGKQKIFILTNLLFAAATLYLFVLAYLEILTLYQIIPYMAAYVIHLIFLVQLPVRWRTDNEQLFEFRRKYMIAYLTATIAVFFILNFEC